MQNLFSTISIACLVLSSRPSLAVDQYSVTDLGTLGDAVGAAGVNNNGVSVGYALDLLYRYHGWVNTDSAFDPVTAMGMNAQGQMMGINDGDQSIFASYMLGMLRTNATIYNGSMFMMVGDMMPTAINNNDIVIGSRFVTTPSGLREEHACSWSMVSGIVDLPLLNNASSSIAKGLNEAGWIVGSSTPAGSIRPIATMWWDGFATNLGTLGGQMSQAIAINASNQVVGISELPNGETHAFRYQLNESGGVVNRVDLGTLAGGYSIALSINNQGAIVGTSGNRAVIWENDLLSDLNTRIKPQSGWILNKATGINESGQIVGVGSLGGDPFRAFLLTPMDECVADLNNDGLLNFFDVSTFLQLFSAGDLTADFNSDDTLNFLDVSVFLSAYSAGCP